MAVGLGLAVLRPLIAWRLAAVAERPRTRLDEVFLELAARTHRLFIFILAVYAGATVLILPEPARSLANSIIVVALLAQTALWVNHLVITWLARQAEASGADDPATATGLGVGGIAVALATQNILGDLFASLSIVLDKPFAKRAFIVFGTVHQTPPDKVAAIPDMVREIIEAQTATRFERGHFTGFGDSSLDFEFVYHMEAPDGAVYMDARQAINLAILRRFEADGIAFAYPTRTLFVERGEDSPG